jgi:hypothetical protein
MRLKVVIRLLLASCIYSISSHGQAVDPRGPIIAYAGVEATPQGVSLPAAPMVFAKEELSARQTLWEPKWIALPADDKRDTSAIRLRKEFVVPDGRSITHARALVTADPFYRLWVNGHLVSRGPDDAGSDYSPHERWSHQWLANPVDVTKYLHTKKMSSPLRCFPIIRTSAGAPQALPLNWR